MAREQKKAAVLPLVKKLRRRLTAVFVTLTGLVLAGVLLVSLVYATGQEKQTSRERFSVTAIGTAYDLLYGDISTARFAQLEEANSMVIFASVDASPVSFDAGYQPETEREALFVRAVETVAESEGEGWTWGESLFGLVDGSIAIAVEESEALQSAHPLEGFAVESYDGEDRYTMYFSGNTLYDVVIATPAGEERLYTYDGESYYYSGSGDEVDLGSSDLYQALPGVQVAQPQETTEAYPDGLYEVEGQFAADSDAIYFVALGATEEMRIEGENGDSYRGMYLEVVDQTNLAHYELLVLQDIQVTQNAVAWIYLLYALLFLCGLAVLWGISWLLARLVTMPTEEGLHRQADFVAAASHELKNPLAVMRASLSAAEVAETEADRKRYNSAAESEAERMSRLVEDLLLLAGGDAGSWKLTSETVDMDTLLIDLHDQYGPLAKEKGAKLHLDLPEETLGEVKGDAMRLKQILGVLLDNAFCYAPQGTKVELCARRHRGRLEIEVTDHGGGIPEEKKALVFQRFYRAEESRSDKNHFGLGLSVAQELAELHGGGLTLHDTPGGGATFRLVLPA